MEIWIDIKDFEGIYAVSNLGRVRREKEGRHTQKGKILRPGTVNDYYFVCLCKNKKRYTKRVSLLVARAFLGKRPKNKVTDHKDGNKKNNNIMNLQYISSHENNIKGKGRKFKEKDVMSLMKDYSYGNIPQKLLAERYQMHPSTVSRIINGSRWKDRLKYQLSNL